MARSVWLVSVVAATLALAPLRAMSASPEEARERMFQMVKSECRDGACKLSNPEIDSLRGDLDRYADRGGRQGEMRSALRSSLETGCKGVCLAEVVRSMNHLMDQGRADRQAREAIGKALREDKQERDRQKLQLSDAECMDRFHSRMEQQHGPGHDAMRERAGDASRDMQHGPAGAAHEGPARMGH